LCHEQERPELARGEVDHSAFLLRGRNFST